MTSRSCPSSLSRRWPVLSCVVASAMLAACGGGDGEITVPVNNGLPEDAASSFPPPGAELSQYELHLANATANAGTAPLFVDVLRPQWCWTAEHPSAPPELQDRVVVPATRIFDDVYFMGPRWVSQYVFSLPDGIFLLDTLNNEGEVKSITEPELRGLGLDPARIFAAMPTHGHGDHHGGGAYLQTTYGSQIYLGSGDTANKPFTAIPIDSANLAPQSLSVGSLDLTVLSTPGHTPGTVSGVIPVRHNGAPHKVAFWGGTGMPNALDAARNYLDGTERLWQLSYAEGIDGTIHTHPFVDGSLVHVDQIRSAGLGEENPFLIGNENAMRSLSVLRSCAAAKVAQIDAAAVIPEWRFSTMQVAATWIPNRGDNLSASARVKSPYGVVSEGQVEFTFAPGGETCMAELNDEGIATCTVTSSENSQEGVTARYTGAESTTVLNLPSKVEAGVTPLG